jgi:hypothetical protein
MGKVITVSAVVALLASSAFAQLGIGNIGPQEQRWGIGLSGTVGMDSGNGSAHNDQQFGTLLIQGASNDEGTQAWQGTGALICQSANVNTVGAPMSANQGVGINGDGIVVEDPLEPDTFLLVPLGQKQSIAANAGPTTQYEGVAVEAQQTLDKDAGGTGNSDAKNTVVTGMAQVADKNCTTMGQGMLMGGRQNSTLDGTTCSSSGCVNTNMGITVVQSQQAGCPLNLCPTTD